MTNIKKLYINQKVFQKKIKEQVRFKKTNLFPTIILLRIVANELCKFIKLSFPKPYIPCLCSMGYISIKTSDYLV